MYQEEPYMTPRDFLFSVMLENVDRKMLLCDVQSGYVDEKSSSQSTEKLYFSSFRAGQYSLKIISQYMEYIIIFFLRNSV